MGSVLATRDQTQHYSKPVIVACLAPHNEAVEKPDSEPYLPPDSKRFGVKSCLLPEGPGRENRKT